MSLKASWSVVNSWLTGDLPLFQRGLVFQLLHSVPYFKSRRPRALTPRIRIPTPGTRPFTPLVFFHGWNLSQAFPSSYNSRQGITDTAPYLEKNLISQSQISEDGAKHYFPCEDKLGWRPTRLSSAPGSLPIPSFCPLHPHCKPGSTLAAALCGHKKRPNLQGIFMSLFEPNWRHLPGSKISKAWGQALENGSFAAYFIQAPAQKKKTKTLFFLLLQTLLL